MKRFYHVISTYAHPSLRAALLDMEYNRNMVEYALDGILILSYANITALLDTVVDLFNVKEVRDIQGSRLRILASLGMRHSFEPNHSNIKGQVRIIGTRIKKTPVTSTLRKY